jgi:hypothetical protein
MSTSLRTVEDRIAAYRQPLDEALEQNPAPFLAVERHDRPGQADPLNVDDFERQELPKISVWPKYAAAAASVMLLVGAGLLIASRTDPPKVDSPSPAVDSSVPATSPAPQPSTPEVTIASGTAANGQTFGTLPNGADSDADVDEILAESPDFVAVWSRDGSEIAGYVAKLRMFSGDTSWEYLEVFATDLTTVVGYWYDGIGFVGLDEDVSRLTPSTSIVVYDY